MTIGVALPSGDTDSAPNLVDELITQTRQAAEAGLKSVWFSQLPLSQDAIAIAALAGREVPGIEVGTSVVPTYPRHPLLVASAAQTAQAATGGRFTLGIGLGSKGFLGPVYGLDYPPPIRHLREYLTVLRQAFAGETVDFDGETVHAHSLGPSTVAGGGDVPIVAAAMGPQALAVTDDPDAVRALAVEQMAFYGQIPSYRKILDAEGVDHPAELALIGDEKTVARGIQRYYDAGATDVVLTQTGIRSAEERLRTWAALSPSGS